MKEKCDIQDCSKEPTCFIHKDDGIEAYCLEHYKEKSIENEELKK